MARITQGPATQKLIVCACGSKTATPAGVVGNVKCSGCGAVNRARR